MNFKQFLESLGDINSRSSWSNIKISIQDNPKFKTNVLTDKEKETIFNEIIDKLKSLEKKKQQLYIFFFIFIN